MEPGYSFEFRFVCGVILQAEQSHSLYVNDKHAFLFHRDGQCTLAFGIRENGYNQTIFVSRHAPVSNRMSSRRMSILLTFLSVSLAPNTESSDHSNFADNSARALGQQIIQAELSHSMSTKRQVQKRLYKVYNHRARCAQGSQDHHVHQTPII